MSSDDLCYVQIKAFKDKVDNLNVHNDILCRVGISDIYILALRVHFVFMDVRTFECIIPLSARVKTRVREIKKSENVYGNFEQEMCTFR